MIEILSPDQSTTKLIAKIQTCLAQGTQLGWLVDPTERVIIALFPDSRMILLSQSDTASSPMVRRPVPVDLPLELTVDQVFAGLRSP